VVSETSALLAVSGFCRFGSKGRRCGVKDTMFSRLKLRSRRRLFSRQYLHVIRHAGYTNRESNAALLTLLDAFATPRSSFLKSHNFLRFEEHLIHFYEIQ